MARNKPDHQPEPQADPALPEPVADTVAADSEVQPAQAETPPADPQAPAGITVAARLLRDGPLGRVNEVVRITAAVAPGYIANGEIDTAPEAVAYARQLAAGVQ